MFYFILERSKTILETKEQKGWKPLCLKGQTGRRGQFEIAPLNPLFIQ